MYVALRNSAEVASFSVERDSYSFGWMSYELGGIWDFLGGKLLEVLISNLVRDFGGLSSRCVNFSTCECFILSSW